VFNNNKYSASCSLTYPHVRCVLTNSVAACYDVVDMSLSWLLCKQ